MEIGREENGKEGREGGDDQGDKRFIARAVCVAPTGAVFGRIDHGSFGFVSGSLSNGGNARRYVYFSGL